MRRGSLPERLAGVVTSNFGTKVVSVAIAVILWGIVLGSRNVEVTKEIPLEVITPPDIVPSNEIPDRIAFRLSGPKAFLRSILDRREDPIRVNLSGAKPALVTYRFFSDNIRVPIGVKVLSIHPTAILIKLEYQKRREFPVRVEYRGALPDGYRIVKATVRPETIRIKGAESRLDSINEIMTAPIDLSGLKKSVEREVSLNLPHPSLQVDGSLPRVLLDIQPISANFRVKNVDIRVLSPHKVRLDVKNLTVLVRASAQEIQSLDKSLIFGVIDLKDKGKGKYTAPVRVTLPKDVGLVKVIPDHVNVTVY